MIRIRQVRKQFDATVALSDINMDIEEGSIVALLGPSGCGKTTTLNVLAGLIKPTSGEVYFGDKAVTHLAPKDRNIGMVFQSYALYPHMKVIDNIAFPLKQKGMKRADRYRRAEDIARKIQIDHLLQRKPAQLSGGQQQRVALARALVKNPDVLLLDEPMSNLDTRLKIEVREEIKMIQRETGVTAVIVTHDQEEAMAISDKIAILDNGKIQQFGTPKELHDKPANLFVAHYMGNPPMNFLEGVVEQGDRLFVRGSGFQYDVPPSLAPKVAAYAGRNVVVGVRPPDFLLCGEGDGFAGTVLLTESLDRGQLIKCKVGTHSIRALLGGDRLREPVQEGETLRLKISGDHVSIFAKENGANIAL